jgi:Putative prokaryotic signal transducing protein
MPCIHWTTDLIEAEILCSLLREQGIDAQIPSADIVRQNWMVAIALGGYRITVNAADTQAANEVLRRWRNGEFAIADDPAVATQCPRCQSSNVVEDTLPRRWRFVALFFFELPLPMALHCQRCGNCGNRWSQANANSYRELAALADAAENQH